MSGSEVLELRSAANLLVDRIYTLGFYSDRLFCSKFVYLTYRSIDVEVGKLQTFGQLLADNPSASINFWKVWFLGFIPWDRRTVTPASQLNDPKFLSVLKSS